MHSLLEMWGQRTFCQSVCWQPGKLPTAAVKGQPVAGHQFDLSHCCKICRKNMEEKRLLHCGNCRAVSYCSKSCQRKDWGQQKAICLATQELSERNDVYNALDSDALPVYPTTLTPKEQTKIAKLIGQKCTMLCRIDGVEIKVLLDTSAQVSIMNYQDFVSKFPGIKAHTIEELLESVIDLELTTANGTQSPYLGWIETTIELKGPSKKSNKVIVPMLITGATLDLPIIGYNVLEELLSMVVLKIQNITYLVNYLQVFQ